MSSERHCPETDSSRCSDSLTLSQGDLKEEWEEEFQEPERSRTSQDHDPQNQLNRALRDPQRLNRQSWILKGSEIDRLHTRCCTLAWDFCWNLNNWSRGISDFIACLWELFPSTGVALSSLDMRVCS